MATRNAKVAVLFCGAVRIEAHCPAGPFQLHNFNVTSHTGAARPYFIVVCDLATNTRMDPLMMPGECNSHMHSFFGSNRFGDTVSLADSTLGPNELANTTCNIPADGSMYWAPSLYFHNRTEGRFHIVPSYFKAYYFNRGNTFPMERMPVGLRMLRGNPYRNGPLVWEHKISNDTVNIFWYGSNNTGGFPDFLNGDWQARIMFPNCWDGKTLKSASKTTNTHVVFRNESNGLCPLSHPQRIPQLFTEVNYQIEKYSKQPGAKPGDFLLATGDKNGWGIHVDYISGWQQDVLDAALETCINTDQGNPDCAFHQFAGDISAGNSGGPVGSMLLHKKRPIEEVTNITQLLVTGEEVQMSGFPAAKCKWGEARPAPSPLINKKGVLNTTHCPPKPTPPTKPTPLHHPTPSPQPPGTGDCVYRLNTDVQGGVLAKEGPGKSAKECCEGCKAHAGCEMVVNFNGWCYYKKAGRETAASARTACIRKAE